MSEYLAEIGECLICQESFSDKNPPRSLTCGHFFCEADVKELDNCILCSSPIEKYIGEQASAESSIDTVFPKNEQVLKYLKVSAKPEIPQCISCKNAEVELFCAEDEAALCEKCWEECHKLPKQKSHKRHKWSQFIVTVHRSRNCHVHPTKRADTVCVNPDCSNVSDLVCSLCTEVGPHLGCGRKLLNSVVQPARAELTTLMERGSIRRTSVDKSIRLVTKPKRITAFKINNYNIYMFRVMIEMKLQLQDSVAAVQKSIQTRFMQLRDLLQKRETTLMCQVAYFELYVIDSSKRAGRSFGT